MKKGSLKKFFDRVSAEAERIQRPVRIPLKKIGDVFEPHHSNFQSAPDQHGIILANLDQVNRLTNWTSPNARAFLTNPGYKIIIRGEKSQFGGIADEPDRELPGSSGIFYTEDVGGMRKKSVAIIMRRTSKNYQDMDNSVVFGIYGHVLPDGTLDIKKILVPEIDHKFHATGTRYIPVTPKNVEAALKYAELCKTQLFENRPFTPIDNLDRAGFHIGPEDRKKNWLFKPFSR